MLDWGGEAPVWEPHSASSLQGNLFFPPCFTGWSGDRIRLSLTMALSGFNDFSARSCRIGDE